MPRDLTAWTRNDSIALGRVAMQAGLRPDNAPEALMIGARMIAHGFSGYEIDEMIRHQYQVWAEEERAVEEKNATVSQYRNWWNRMRRD